MKADHLFEAWPVESTGHSQRSCRHCGKVPEWHPQSAADPERRPAWEREYLLGAAGGPHGVDAADLVALAQDRAHEGPLKGGRNGRDWGLEIVEEMADAANYLAWWEQLDSPDSEGFGDRQRLRAQAVQHVAIVHFLIEQARAW